MKETQEESERRVCFKYCQKYFSECDIKECFYFFRFKKIEENGY